MKTKLELTSKFQLPSKSAPSKFLRQSLFLCLSLSRGSETVPDKNNMRLLSIIRMTAVYWEISLPPLNPDGQLHLIRTTHMTRSGEGVRCVG